jgi:D-glycero-D-manno-heptose 1,7-bisphosphate phosphatase
MVNNLDDSISMSNTKVSKLATKSKVFGDEFNNINCEYFKISDISLDEDIKNNNSFLCALENNIKIQILLAHPESEALSDYYSKAENRTLAIAKKKILDDTKYLLSLDNNLCEVRWYLEPPIFSFLSNNCLMSWSPIGKFDNNTNHIYKLESKNPIYESSLRWFDSLWIKSNDPIKEISWVEREVKRCKAIFLDRDDTLIKDLHYFGDWKTAKIEILPTVIEGLKLLSEEDYRLIVVSNQQAVGLKLHSKRDLELLSQRIKDVFVKEGINLDAFYYCTHSVAQQCMCRKPNAELFHKAASDFQLIMDQCIFIGDKDSDANVIKSLPSLDIYIVNENYSFIQIIIEILNKAKSKSK